MKKKKEKKDDGVVEALKEYRRKWAEEHEEALKEAEEEIKDAHV